MKNLFISFLLIFSFDLFSQTKPAPAFYASLDCANSSREVNKSNLEKCTKLVLSGPDSENYTILSASISFKVGEVIKEFYVVDGILSKEILAQLLKSKAGDYFFLENVRAKQVSSEVVKSLQTSKIKVIAN
ncbi:MAG: hypothetical protein JNK50_05170 [Bacteroidia bacterium]|nr:hypothetical protein [Bacteroidia bacterium]